MKTQVQLYTKTQVQLIPNEDRSPGTLGSIIALHRYRRVGKPPVLIISVCFYHILLRSQALLSSVQPSNSIFSEVTHVHVCVYIYSIFQLVVALDANYNARYLPVLQIFAFHTNLLRQHP